MIDPLKKRGGRAPNATSSDLHNLRERLLNLDRLLDLLH